MLKRVRRYVIVSLSERDKKQHNTDRDFACVLRDEMEFTPSLHELNLKCDSLQEAFYRMS